MAEVATAAEDQIEAARRTLARLQENEVALEKQLEVQGAKLNSARMEIDRQARMIRSLRARLRRTEPVAKAAESLVTAVLIASKEGD